MTTLPFRDPAETAAAVPRAVAHLRAGGVLAHPTETVYGFGTMLEPAALERLARLKQREQDRPFLLLVAGEEQAPGLLWPDAARALANAFWPGPLTLALRAPAGGYPAAVVSSKGTVALRATSQPGLRALLHALSSPMTSTSANLAGRAPASSADEVRVVVEAADPRESGVVCLDAGTLPAAPPSTIVEFVATRPRLVRAGAVGLAALRAVVEEIDV